MQSVSLWMGVIVGIFILTEKTSFAQGTFRNLDFESANIPAVPFGQIGGSVSPEDGLPGWTVYPGGLGHNVLPLGGSAAVIFGPEWVPSTILQGSYSVGIFTSASEQGYAIGQSGRIPQNAKSLRFFGKEGVVNVAITFAGNPLPFSDLGGNDQYHSYGADVSGYAGQTGELRFTGVPAAPNSVNSAFIDNIQFSPVLVPEPATLSVFLAGLALLSRGIMGRKPELPLR